MNTPDINLVKIKVDLEMIRRISIMLPAIPLSVLMIISSLNVIMSVPFNLIELSSLIAVFAMGVIQAMNMMAVRGGQWIDKLSRAFYWSIANIALIIVIQLVMAYGGYVAQTNGEMSSSTLTIIFVAFATFWPSAFVIRAYNKVSLMNRKHGVRGAFSLYSWQKCHVDSEYNRSLIDINHS